jgi:protein translocase SecG subunit
MLAAVALIFAILSQKKRDAGGVGSIAGMGNVDTHGSRYKGRTIDDTLEKWTKIGGAVLGVLAVVLCLV